MLIVRPLGRAGEIAYVIGDVPPDAVTGVKLIAAAPAVRVSAAIARFVERAEVTVSENVFVAVADTASVTVTV